MSLFLNHDCKVPVDCSNPLIGNTIVLNCKLISHDGNCITLDDNCSMLAGSCMCTDT